MLRTEFGLRPSIYDYGSYYGNQYMVDFEYWNTAATNKLILIPFFNAPIVKLNS